MAKVLQKFCTIFAQYFRSHWLIIDLLFRLHLVTLLHQIALGDIATSDCTWWHSYIRLHLVTLLHQIALGDISIVLTYNHFLFWMSSSSLLTNRKIVIWNLFWEVNLPTNIRTQSPFKTQRNKHMVSMLLAYCEHENKMCDNNHAPVTLGLIEWLVL